MEVVLTDVLVSIVVLLIWRNSTHIATFPQSLHYWWVSDPRNENIVNLGSHIRYLQIRVQGDKKWPFYLPCNNYFMSGKGVSEQTCKVTFALWSGDSRNQELKESKIWCLTWGETAGLGSAVGVRFVSISVATFPSGSIKALIFGILCWNEAARLQRTDHSPGKVLCWTFTCHSKVSVLARLWKMYPLCSCCLLQQWVCSKG